MVVPKHNIVKTLSINLDVVMRPNNTELIIKQPKDTTVNIQCGYPTLCANIRGPCNNTLLPLNSSSSSKIDYTKQIYAQNNMDIEVNLALLISNLGICNPSFSLSTLAF